MSSCVFSQNVGDSVLVLSLQGAHRGVSRQWAVDGAGGQSFADHCKIISARSSACVPAFPHSRTLSSGAVYHSPTAIVWSEPPRAVGRKRLPSSGSRRTQASSALVGKPLLVCQVWCGRHSGPGPRPFLWPLLSAPFCDRTGCVPWSHAPLLLS